MGKENMIDHFVNRGDYVALFFIVALGLRVVVLIWQMIKAIKEAR